MQFEIYGRTSMRSTVATALVDEDLPPPIRSDGEQTLDTFLELWAERTPNALAFSDAPNRNEFAIGQTKHLTFSDVYEMSGRLAKQFREHGLNPGHILAIQLPNIVELPVIVLAALRAGLIACPLPFLWRKYEIQQAFQQVPVRALMTVGDFEGHSHSEMMCELAFDNLGVRFIYGIGPKQADGVTSLNSFFEPEGSVPETHETYTHQNSHNAELDNPAIITWSMRPGIGLKPIYRTHRELIASGLMHVLEVGLSPTDRLLNPYPLTGLIGLSGMFMPSLLIGASVIQHHPFNYQAFIDQMRTEKATYAAAPAPVLNTLQEDGILSKGEHHLKSFGCVWQVPHEKYDARVQPMAATLPIYDIRNLHETAVYISKRDDSTINGEIKLGDIKTREPNGNLMRLLETRFKGRMRSGSQNASQVRASMKGSSEKGANDTPFDKAKAFEKRFSGTLFVRGVSVPKGSGFDETETKKNIYASYDDWVNTGIHCHVNDQNARMDQVICEADPDMIYHGGAIVCAKELDQIYASYEGFEDAAAFATPDPVLGERIFVAAIPRNPHTISKQDFDAYLKNLGLAPYKIPEQIVIVDDIPKDINNNILRHHFTA